MKKVLFLLSAMCLMSHAHAQVPQAFNYQAVLRDPLTGLALADRSGTVRFVLHADAPTGPEVYSEDHALTTNDQGLFSTYVGNGAATTGTFDPAAWSAVMFLEVRLDLDNTGSFTSMSTQQLLSVPFALRAGKSSNVPDGTEVGQLMHWDGGAWVADSGLYVHQQRFGIGTNEPPAPFAIVHRNILKSFFATGTKPQQRQRGMGLIVDSTGFAFAEGHIDSLRSRLFVQSGTGHIGIGTNEPPAPLTIEDRSKLKAYFQTGDIPTQDDFGLLSDSTGFSIDQGPPGSSSSRLFIDATTGNVGVGTTSPAEKYHIHGVHQGGHVGMRISNGAANNNQGWMLGHFDDAIQERSGAFSILEDGLTSYERVTILPGGNVGINEEMPYATLHVTRPPTDPNTPVSLSPNSGIAMFGHSSQHIVLDDQGIQARHLLAGATSVVGSSGSLRLQPLGGELLVHSNDADDARKFILTNDGKIGVGTLLPQEKLHVNGAVVLGNSSNTTPVAGTIRFTGTDFEGRVDTGWVGLSGLWRKRQTDDDIWWKQGSRPRVGIGTDTPTSTLHVLDEAAVTGDDAGVSITNASTTSGSGTRVGLKLATSGQWSTSDQAKNIGLLVSSSGASQANANLAAVLNGNVVVGSVLNGMKEVGTSGQNVLAIQNGAAPTDAIGSGNGQSDGGVQLYVTSDATGVSTLHIMDGSGHVVELHLQNPLSAPDNTTLNPLYDASTAAVIENMRTRINELEARMRALGLLP